MTKGLLTSPVCDIACLFTVKDRVSYTEELILPDYFPDIERVIFLKSRSAVSEARAADGEISVSGLTFLNLCCEDSDGNIKSTEFSVPFKKNFPLKKALANPIIFCDAQSDSVSYKLISKRRIDVRGAFSLEGRAFDTEEKDILSSSKNSSIIVKKENIKNLCLSESLNESISLSDEFILPEDKPKSEQVLDAEISVIPKECYLESDNLYLKGIVLMHMLYTPRDDEKRIESADISLPFDKVWDSFNFREGAVIKPRLKILSSSVAKSQEVIKEDGQMLFEGEIGCELIVLQEEDTDFIKDCFSPSFECEKADDRICLFTKAKDFQKESEVTGEIPSPADMRETEDTSARIEEISISDENGKTAFCDVKFNVIFKNAENKLSSLSHTLRCAVPLSESRDKQLSLISGYTESVNTSLYNGKLRFSCKIKLQGCLLDTDELTVLTDINLLEDKPVKRNSDFSMIIYYADNGDDLWSIGKKYKADPEKIKEENSLKEDDFKNRTPLIIPL